jgi:uroporphyrinogen decarboxylase
MFTAYRNQQPDCVPISPELWYDIPLTISRVPFEDVCLGNCPLWRIQLTAHEYFGTDAWIVPFPGRSAAVPEPRIKSRQIDNKTMEIEYVYETSRGPLRRVTRNTDVYYDWAIERPVKDLRVDMPKHEEVVLADPTQCDLSEITDALAGVGDKGLVTPFIGKLFFDFIASAREGESTQAIYDFSDHRDYLKDLHARYVRHMETMAETIIRATHPAVVFVENGYSSIGIISPAMYREWDKPVIEAVSRVAKAHGVLLHVHQHGPSMSVLQDLIEAGVDLVDPLERPRSGDVVDLAAVKMRYGGKIALRGNLHSHDVLLRGTPADVEHQVRECIRSAGPGGGYILATGDGAIVGTPLENLHAMVEAGQKWGRYPLELLDQRRKADGIRQTCGSL